jgi:RNA polymerase primary sigma factor
MVNQKLEIMKQIHKKNDFTDHSSTALDKYLTAIGKVDLITAEEEVILAQKIRAGDEAALERLVKTNLRFVVTVAKQYQNQGLLLGDLINEGNLGLMKAAKRFDETKGFKFISYAVWWIRQSILQAIAMDSRIIRLPLSQTGPLSDMKKAFSALEQEYEREPTPEELARAMEMPVTKIKDLISNPTDYVSMDAPVPFSEGGKVTAHDIFSDETEAHKTDTRIINKDLLEEIGRALRSLSDREREIIVWHFGLNGEDPLTLRELAAKFGLHYERIRQLRDQALEQMKKQDNLERTTLRTFLVDCFN